MARALVRDHVIRCIPEAAVILGDLLVRWEDVAYAAPGAVRLADGFRRFFVTSAQRP